MNLNLMYYLDRAQQRDLNSRKRKIQEKGQVHLITKKLRKKEVMKLLQKWQKFTLSNQAKSSRTLISIYRSTI